MDITTNLRKVQRDLRQQKLSEQKICEVIPNFYEDKCGQFLYPLIPFDPKQWKLNPSSAAPSSSASLITKRPKSNTSITSGEEPWTYKKFEKKLSNGVLTIPNLNLEQVPASIFGFTPPLRIIYLNDNSLRDLPYNLFDDLPSLAWLDIRNNKVRQLPELTRPHEALRTLLLQNNQIVRLPLTLYLAQELTTIQLRGNPVIDPPPKIVQSGTPGILKYLADRVQHPEILEHDDTMSEYDLDEAVTLFPPLSMRRKDSGQLGSSGDSKSDSSVLESLMIPKSKALKALYSDALWRHVAHAGPTSSQILSSVQEELRISVQRKLANQKEAILQRMRDREARMAFQKTARQLQLNGSANRKAENYEGPKAPFGTSDPTVSKYEPKTLGLEDFQREFLKNWDRLNTLTSNPVSIDNVEQTKNRLKEVEEIQQKISNMKLSMKIPI